MPFRNKQNPLSANNKKRGDMLVLNNTRFSNRNQEKNKKTSPFKGPGRINEAQKGYIALSTAFKSDPVGWLLSQPDSVRATLKVFMTMKSNGQMLNLSRKGIAERIGTWPATVSRSLNVLKASGILGWIRPGHMQRNLYFINPFLFKPEITKVLKSLIPALAFFFCTMQLSSNPNAFSFHSEYKPRSIKEIYKRSYLRNERANTGARDSQKHSKLEIPGEIAGDAWFTTPELRPIEMEWYRRNFLPIRFKTWAKHNPGDFQHVEPCAARYFVGDLKPKDFHKREACKPKNNDLTSVSLKQEIEKMLNIDNLSHEQREKFKETAMRNLLPKSARHFNAIPLTLAGKIHLSLYTNQAIEYAGKTFNRKLHPQVAFNELCTLARDFCIRNETPINHEAKRLLLELHGLDFKAPRVKTNSKRAERQVYVHQQLPKKTNPVYIDFFKAEEQCEKLKKSGFALANFYQKAYELFLDEAVKSTGQERSSLHRSFYELYESQKKTKLTNPQEEKDEVHTPRKADPTVPSSAYNVPNSTRL